VTTPDNEHTITHVPVRVKGWSHKFFRILQGGYAQKAVIGAIRIARSPPSGFALTLLTAGS